MANEEIMVAVGETHFPERRSGTDRRGRQTRPWHYSSLIGRRRHFRRKEDRESYYYVDRYGAKVLCVLFATVLLSLADAFLTLKHIRLGAIELNPVMGFFLGHGVLYFVLAKYILTAGGLAFFLVHKEYPIFSKRIKGKDVLAGASVLYVILLFYEVMLFM